MHAASQFGHECRRLYEETRCESDGQLDSKPTIAHTKHDYLENLLPVLGLRSKCLPDSFRNHSVVIAIRLHNSKSDVLIIGSLSKIIQHRSRSTPVLVRKGLIQSLFQLGLLSTLRIPLASTYATNPLA